MTPLARTRAGRSQPASANTPSPEAQTGDPEPLTTDYSDIDLRRWRDYTDILTGSLWLLGARDHSGPHNGDYWGNFVPQIPNQIIRRFTKAGDVVVDLFSGMGTTLIECRHLGRHGIGVELSESVAEQSLQRIAQALNPGNVSTEVFVGDSRLLETRVRVEHALAGLNKPAADCLLLHPPYYNIIQFSSDPRDLSRAPSIPAFLQGFKEVASQAVSLLAPGRYLALVIGDIYTNSEWIPLGFQCLQVCQELGLQLKAINVKDIQGNERGKGVSEHLWRYRALRQGFYVFKHEYIMLFRKPAVSSKRQSRG